MENKKFINHIIEPTELLLIWQDSSSRERFIVAKLYKTNNDIQLKYLKNTKDFEAAIKLGFTGYSAFNLDKDEYNNVSQSFTRRLPTDARADFSDYLEGFRLKPNQEISEFALLGYTGAKLPSDTFSILNTFYNYNEPFEFLLEVAGFRFSKVNINDINIGDEVSFEIEHNKALNEEAIKINLCGKKIGYVTRGLIPTFLKWLNENKTFKAYIEKKNGTKEKPMLYIYVECF